MSAMDSSNWIIKSTWHGARPDLCGDEVGKEEADKVERAVDGLVVSATEEDAVRKRDLVDGAYRNGAVMPNLRKLAQVLSYVV